jgi:hypothetical protein
MKNTLIILNYVNVIATCSYSFHTILYICLFCVHNEIFGDAYECGEGNHNTLRCTHHMISKLPKNASKTKYCAPQDIMKVALRLESI